MITCLAGSSTSFIPEFELELKNEAAAAEDTAEQPRLSVHNFARKLSEFFVRIWNGEVLSTYAGPPMVFVVGGYDEDAAHGRVFLFWFLTRMYARSGVAGGWPGSGRDSGCSSWRCGIHTPCG